MGTVGTIGLWIGIISGIISITLAIVAIVISASVNRRANDINDQTIKSLQKIETEVERLSEDTRGLIKAGWDKMLGSFGISKADDLLDEDAIRKVSEGLVAELKSEIDSASTDTHLSKKQSDELSSMYKKIEERLSSIIESSQSISSARYFPDIILDKLRKLSPLAIALLNEIRPRHLTDENYKSLLDGELLRQPVLELRKVGFLVPLPGYSKEYKEIPVYYYPPNMTRLLNALMPISQDIPLEVGEIVKNELQRIHYYENI